LDRYYLTFIRIGRHFATNQPRAKKFLLLKKGKFTRVQNWGINFSNSTVNHTGLLLEDTAAFISAKAAVIPLVAIALHVYTCTTITAEHSCRDEDAPSSVNKLAKSVPLSTIATA